MNNRFGSIYTRKQLIASGFILGLAVAGVAFAPTPSRTAEPVILQFKQARDSAPREPLTDAERSELGDPLFSLVLRDHADVTNLAQIETLLQPDAKNRQLFVVDEDIADAMPGQHRRSVLAFKGSTNGALLDRNVMLSAFFNSDNFSDTPNELEAWGWDEARGRYNYYKLDRGPNGSEPLSWKFRGSSLDADQMTPIRRRGTCFACHLNGGPIMKELLRPWNNWHSFDSQAAYLTPTGANKWPVADRPRLKGLSGAENLEQTLLAGIARYGRSRIAAQLPLGIDAATGKPNADPTTGEARVVGARRLLRSLFATTEFNLISSVQKSGMHKVPFDAADSLPKQPVTVPASSLLNADLIAGGGIPQYQGLGIAEAGAFRQLVTLTPAEYKGLLKDTGTQLKEVAGDTNFAWFVPEASHADNALVDQLLQKGLVSRRFAAAALAIDLEHPVLSADRAALLAFVPDEYGFAPGTPGGSGTEDELTQKTVAALEASRPAAGTPAAKFLERLKDPDPVARLREDVAAYRDRVKSALADPATRLAEIKRLYDEALLTRRKVLNDPALGTLDETAMNLLPLGVSRN